MSKQQPKVTPEQFNLFMAGKITSDELLGERFEKPKSKFTPTDPTERKKAKRDEDNIQRDAIAYLQSRYPHIPIYGNATANIFTSGGLYRKALPKAAYGTLAAMGIGAKTWGPLLDMALGKLGLSLKVSALEKDQEGAKFAQMKRTKALGAVSSWPDIQVCTSRELQVMDGDGCMVAKRFNGLFLELKKPDASSLPWGASSNGRFTTNDHLQAQAQTLSLLTAQGYLAVFAIGYDEFLAVAELYFGTHEDHHYLQSQPITYKDGTKGMIYRIRKP